MLEKHMSLQDILGLPGVQRWSLQVSDTLTVLDWHANVREGNTKGAVQTKHK